MLLERVLIFAVFFAFYLLTLAHNQSAAHDAMWYLNEILEGSRLFHPHHLFYNAHAIYLWKLAKCLPFVPDARNFVSGISAFWGGMAMSEVYHILRIRAASSQRSAFLFTALIASFFGVWAYSTTIEACLPPIFFLLTAFRLFSEENPSTKTRYAAIFAHIFAILFHQIHALFTLPALYFLFQNQQGRKAQFQYLFRYAGLGISFVMGAYILIPVLFLKIHTVKDWLGWMISYASSDNDFWEALSWQTPLKVAIGWSHCLLGGHFMFAIPEVQKAMQALLSGQQLEDELFLVRKLPKFFGYALLLMTLAWSGVAATMLSTVFVHRKKITSTIFGKGILWGLLVYALFFCFWVPANAEFWITQSILLGVWVAVRWQKTGKSLALPLILLLLQLVVNYGGSIFWLSDTRNDFYAMHIDFVAKETTTKDLLLITPNNYMTGEYLRYFSPAQVEEMQDSAAIDYYVQKALNTQKAGGNCYLYANPLTQIRACSQKKIDSLAQNATPVHLEYSFFRWDIQK